MTIIPGGKLQLDGVLAALSFPTEGTVYDLDPGRWPGMPIWAGHPPFQVLTYRSPNGIRLQGDQDWLRPEVNAAGIGLVSELMLATNHSGSHVDALGHICSGPGDEFWGGSAKEDLGDFGLLKGDAASILPFVSRGVLIDIPRQLGVDQLDAHHPISLDEFTAALDVQGTEIRQGDVVTVRTGQMAGWPDPAKLALSAGAGITKPIADYCADRLVRAVGTDTEGCEVMPSILSDNPHPVHERLLVQAAIHVLENLFLEDLARDSRYEFLFLGLPLKIQGATGSMLRPLAIV
jgi:kynurenine formamidase